MQKTTGYFHVALINGGIFIATELHGRLLDSGLYDATEEINVNILGDLEQAEAICNNVFYKYKKYKVYFNADVFLFEWFTLQMLYNDCFCNDNDVWYIHTKGASNCKYGIPERIQQNIIAWRHIMCQAAIKDWKNCKTLLEVSDAVGPLFVEKDKYFAGNFWWATANHIRSLSEPEGTRNEAESWIGTNKNAIFKDLYKIPIDNLDFYDFKNVYAEKGVFKWN